MADRPLAGPEAVIRGRRMFGGGPKRQFAVSGIPPQGQVFDGQAAATRNYFRDFDRLARSRRSVTESEQVTTEPAVLPTETEHLPDLAGYLKTVSDPIWLRVHFPSGARP